MLVKFPIFWFIEGRKGLLYSESHSILLSKHNLRNYDYCFIFLFLLLVINSLDRSSLILYSCSLGLFMSTLFYIASMGGMAFMYSSYGMKLSCALNIFFITWTVILLVVMMVISLHSKVYISLLNTSI